MSDSPSSEAPTPPWGLRLENDQADGIERLQTRLLHIGLFLLAAVVLGGGAGILAIATEESRALVVSLSVVAGCVIVILFGLVAAMSATRAVRPTAALRRPAHMPAPAPAPALPLAPPSEVLARRPEPAPLWAHSPAGTGHDLVTDDPGQRREVFVKLARRLQSLINRAIKRIDELEQENEDPVLLDGLYEIDHLFTLARRQGENLAVLGGEAPQRRSNRPVSVYAVLLAAVSEAEHYRQIAIVPVEDVEIHGHAVAEIIHLLAELLENATRFTSPDGPKVEVRAQKVTAGLAIEVQDRGLGMSYEDLERINHLLDGSTRIDISELLEDGRIGLAVVRELARRHDIRVRLQSNIFGGVAAAVVIPHQLLSETAVASGAHRRTQPPSVLRDRQPEPAAIPAAAEPQAVQQPAPPPVEQPAPAPAAPAPSAAASSPGLGPIRPTPARRQQQAETSRAPAAPQHDAAETELPVLPARVPGRSYLDLRTGGNGHGNGGGNGNGNGGGNGGGGAVPENTDQPPPLPQRRGTHLREELLEPPAPTKPVPGHNPSLMKTVLEGRDHWLAEQSRDAGRQQKQGPNEGDSAPWPTT